MQLMLFCWEISNHPYTLMTMSFLKSNTICYNFFSDLCTVLRLLYRNCLLLLGMEIYIAFRRSPAIDARLGYCPLKLITTNYVLLVLLAQNNKYNNKILSPVIDAESGITTAAWNLITTYCITFCFAYYHWYKKLYWSRKKCVTICI